MSARLPISVVIPVKNEEEMLPACLARLKRFSEIIVVDSRSKDRTQQIAHEHGARVLDFDWDGRYPKKRNWVLINHELANPWVLFLDADELVTDAFCDAAAAAIQTPTLVLCGEQDIATPPDMARELVRVIPNARLALIPKAAHISCVEQPEAMAEEMMQFFRGVHIV